MMDTRHLAQAFRAQSLRVNADLSGCTGVLIWDSRCVLVRLEAEQARRFVRRVESLRASGLSSRDAVDACGAMTLQDHLQLTFDFPAGSDAGGCAGLFGEDSEDHARPVGGSEAPLGSPTFTQHGQPSLLFEGDPEQDTQPMTDTFDLFGMPSGSDDQPDLAPGVEF